MLMRSEQMATKGSCVEASDFDRLSNLPDEILHHIMSFMKGRQTVQTCILSKRWKNLWRQLPFLNFNFNRLDFSYCCKFDCFVDSFLKHRGTSPIETLRLDWDFSNVHEATKIWINYVFTSQPLRYVPLELNHSFFPSSSIEAIYLRAWQFPMKEIRHESITLVNLKRLHLSRVFLTDEFMQHLITGCPRLEEMVMESCGLETSITIASHVLKKLIIVDHHSRTDVKIHLSIPSLLSLHVNAILGKVLWENMASVVTAHLNFRYFVPGSYQKSGYELLRGLSNATSLELTCGPFNCPYTNSGLITQPIIKDFLEKELRNCAGFNNLKSLYISKWDVNANFILVAQFVQLSTNLEMLTLFHEEKVQVIRDEENESKEWCFPVRRSCLKKVRIKCSMPPERIEELATTFKAKLETLEKI